MAVHLQPQCRPRRPAEGTRANGHIYGHGRHRPARRASCFTRSVWDKAAARRPAQSAGTSGRIADRKTPHAKKPCSRAGPLILLTTGLYAWKELPQPQVLLTFGFSNLKPAPSRVST